MNLIRPFAALLIVLFAATTFSPAQQDTLTIISVNDTHGNLLPFAGGQYGGIARAASVIGSWKMTEPNPLFVHCGDFAVGTLMYNTYYGVPELKILNALGCDALALGNHEFDFGPENLAGVFAAAELDTTFSIMSTNAVNLDAVPALKPYIKAQVIKQKGALPVGLVALTTPTANMISNPAPVFIDTNIVQEAMAAVQDLRGKGAKVVILLSHLGFGGDSIIAGYLTGVDAIIGAHTHTIMTSVKYVNSIPIVQAGEYYHYVGKLRLVHSTSGTSVLDYTLQEITSDIPAEPTISAQLAELSAGVAAQYGTLLGDPGQQIGYNAQHLAYTPSSVDSPLTLMGKFVTYAMFKSAPGVDCAIEPTGDIASDLAKGPISANELFRSYPYGFDTSDGLGFRLATYTLTGAQIRTALSYAAAMVDPRISYYDFVMQGWRLNYTLQLTTDGVTVDNIQINKRPLDDGARYKIVSSDRVPGFLQAYFGISAENVTIMRKSVVQAMVDFTKDYDSITVRILGVRPVNAHGKPMEGFALGKNYPNPFNPVTRISYTIGVESKVLIRVYNILGQQVGILVDAVEPAGIRSVVWDASGLASGVYFCRVEATSKANPSDRFTQTTRMLLLK